MQPCCMSTQSQSSPVWAITSAGKQCGIESQPPTAGFPSRQSFFTRLNRIAFLSLGDDVDGVIADGSGLGRVLPLVRHLRGDGDDVALCDVMQGAALDVPAAC